MKEYKLKINGNNYNVAINDIDDSVAKVEVNGAPFTVEFEKPITKPKEIKIIRQGASTPNASSSAPKSAAPCAGVGSELKSPLPGVILNVNVKEGDSVKKGQCLLILEAMKMENEIEAPMDGVVRQISVNKGESVLEGACLLTIG